MKCGTRVAIANRPLRPPHIEILTPTSRHRAVTYLREQEPFFDDIVTQWGMPPSNTRAPGFATLMHMILEQQVSLASALAVFNRLATATGVLTPERFLTLDDDPLKAIGFSRQKIAYYRLLAVAILQGDLDLDALALKDDDAVRESLMELAAWLV